MIKSYIDPIFLAVNEKITAKQYSSQIYPLINAFYEKIKYFEKEINNRVIIFNVPTNLIYSCINYNPFQIKSNKIHFKQFLLEFLVKHHNQNCDKIKNLKTMTYLYENENVPNIIIEQWNLHINNCVDCRLCVLNESNLLTHIDLGTSCNKIYPPFFKNIIPDLINWLENKILNFKKELNPLKSLINPDHKFKGNFDHHHSKSPKLGRILNTFKDCDYINKIIPIKLEKIPKSSRLTLYNETTIKAVIKTQKVGEVFLLETTAICESQVENIIQLLKNQIKDLD